MTPALTPMQQSAADQMADAIDRRSGRTFTLHGLAGTGKTTVLSSIARAHPEAILCTLTGKAASVLTRKTGAPAQTIHSAFYKLVGKSKDVRGRKVLHWREKVTAGELHRSAILLDECSMVNDAMAADILRTGATIIACGDPGQLPPVMGKQFFDKPDFTLTEIHRQAQESPIIRQAHTVRQTGRYEADGDAFRVAARGSETDILSADIILCWTNKTRDRANHRARSLRGIWMAYPQPGEPIVCLKNNPDYGLFNGAIYTLAEPFMEGDEEIVVNIDGEITRIPDAVFRGMPAHLADEEDAQGFFDYGYALTVHKSQGSEWPSVVLVDEYPSRRDDRRRWLYTGITRASERLLILGNQTR